MPPKNSYGSVHPTRMTPPRITTPALLLGLLIATVFGPSTALAQWTRVAALPATPVFSVWANADTIVAGADSVTFVSTNAGLSWHKSVRVAAATQVVSAVWYLNHRLYAGTVGQGVFVSDDLGDHWQAFNQGLVGGFLDTQLQINSLLVHANKIYAATAGASVYERSLAAGQTWHPFGNEFEIEQASNVTDIHSRLKARETPQPGFCWHCRKPLPARAARCPFCGEGQN